MRATRSRGAAIALTGVLAVSLSACAGGDDGASGPADLKMALWSSNEDHLALLQEIGDAYVAEHGDEVASITFEPVTNPDYIAGLTTQIAGGDVPDLAWIPEASGPEFVDSGILYDVRETLEGTEGYDLDDIIPAALEPWQDDAGGVYAYPFSNSPIALYVNETLLAEAGQPDVKALVGTPEYTWETVTDIAAATNGATGASGLNIPTFNPTNWSAVTMLGSAWGAAPWSEDGATCEFASPEMIEYLTWYQDQIARGAIPAVSGNAAPAAFASGDVAFSVAQLSQSGSLDDSFEWSFLPLPAGPEGYHPIVGQAGVSVLERSERKEEAAGFLAYLTNSANAELLAQFFPPPRQSLLNVETLSQAAPKLSPEEIQTAIIDVVPEAQVKPQHSVLSQFSDAVRAGLDPVWSGGDVESAVNEICEQISPTLEG
ncbi:ABC transporter substrate-binding protein [Glycomyces harbinensis]|uniref:Multiple sugar transport system substrate-binding protein n=1 Tax=Glycomyces harbinensis TaxID=58114 RepID=A0A1G6X049_9ACTN|nr:extracellular solute-binding protein [Glycomyces harbinensis]SDD70797.1 multiple sugar transport system substrate-binding protein [Glycomyces harbinensis]